MRQIFGVFEKSKNTLGISQVFNEFLMKFNGFSIKWPKLSISDTKWHKLIKMTKIIDF